MAEPGIDHDPEHEGSEKPYSGVDADFNERAEPRLIHVAIVTRFDAQATLESTATGTGIA